MTIYTHVKKQEERDRFIAGVFRQWDNVVSDLSALLLPIALLALRLPVAYVFWRSGRTRVEGWNIFSISENQLFLFEYEFGLPFPWLMAHVTAVAEHILPILLVLGLFTRLGALGMLSMTFVIQFFVFPDAWATAHMFWATILFAVIVVGPGAFSLDHLIRHRVFS